VPSAESDPVKWKFEEATMANDVAFFHQFMRNSNFDSWVYHGHCNQQALGFPSAGSGTPPAGTTVAANDVANDLGNVYVGAWVNYIPGPSIQGLMEAIAPAGPDGKAAIEVRPRAETSPESEVSSLGRRILLDLGNDPQAFLQISTSTERTSGIQAGYATLFRPHGLDQPDNALYDTTFGFVLDNGHYVLDTFTANSARLLPPHRQQVPPSRLAVPIF